MLRTLVPCAPLKGRGSKCRAWPGCKPELYALVLAAVEASLGRRFGHARAFSLYHHVAGPLVLVNGRSRKRIGHGIFPGSTALGQGKTAPTPVIAGPLQLISAQRFGGGPPRPKFDRADHGHPTRQITTSVFCRAKTSGMGFHWPLGERAAFTPRDQFSRLPCLPPKACRAIVDQGNRYTRNLSLAVSPLSPCAQWIPHYKAGDAIGDAIPW